MVGDPVDKVLMLVRMWQGDKGDTGIIGRDKGDFISVDRHRCRFGIKIDNWS